jgi:hypothetical protein
MQQSGVTETRYVITKLDETAGQEQIQTNVPGKVAWKPPQKRSEIGNPCKPPVENENTQAPRDS